MVFSNPYSMRAFLFSGERRVAAHRNALTVKCRVCKLVRMPCGWNWGRRQHTQLRPAFVAQGARAPALARAWSWLLVSNQDLAQHRVITHSHGHCNLSRTRMKQF